MRNTNYIVHQKIALMQMRQAVLLCYLQLLKQYLTASVILTREIKDIAVNASCSDPDNPPEP